jgi:hypothetical protein
VDQQQLSDLLRWVDQFAGASEQLRIRLTTAVLATYGGVNFYSAAEVATAAQAAAATSNTNAAEAAGLAAQYVAVTSSLIAGDALPAPTLVLPALRNGTDMTQVYSRPAKLFRRLRSQGVDPTTAFQRAMAYAAQITDTNVTLAQREAYQQTLLRLERAAGITGYRRIVHPELARTGSCGLCIVASDNVYHTSQLLPIHGGCNCTVLPIVGALDPGNSLNNMTLGDFYAAAARPGGRGPSTSGDDLKKIRVTVNEHGEYGPVLTYTGQKFTGPDDIQLAA